MFGTSVSGLGGEHRLLANITILGYWTFEFVPCRCSTSRWLCPSSHSLFLSVQNSLSVDRNWPWGLRSPLFCERCSLCIDCLLQIGPESVSKDIWCSKLVSPWADMVTTSMATINHELVILPWRYIPTSIFLVWNILALFSLVEFQLSMVVSMCFACVFNHVFTVCALIHILGFGT